MIVLNNSVVDDGDPSFTIKMRMGVSFRYSTMSRPTSMADTNRAGRKIRGGIPNFSDVTIDCDLTGVNHGNSPAVITPIFQSLQAFENFLRRFLLFSNVAKYPTHNRTLSYCSRVSRGLEGRREEYPD